MDTEAYSEHCPTYKMKYFTKIFSGFWLLTIFTKQSTSVVSQGSEYASGTLKVDKNFKQLLKFIGFIDSKVVLIGNK